jgi:hypothetical protein
VNWKVGRTLPKDYIIFVHFIAGDKIVFQADHAPAKPTSQWQVGDTFTDGPIPIPVPAKDSNQEYEFHVGLYNADGRVPLVNGSLGELLAHVEVERDGDKVTKISFKPATQQPTPGVDPAPYLEGANRGRKVVDFGPVATNGAVVLRKTANGLDLIPVPLGEPMRVGVAGKYRAASVAGKPLQSTIEGGKLWFEVPAGAEKVVVR